MFSGPRKQNVPLKKAPIPAVSITGPASTLFGLSTDDKIRDEKLQYYINREAAKISALSYGKIDRYEYLTAEDIVPFNQRQVIEQATTSHKIFETNSSFHVK